MVLKREDAFLNCKYNHPRDHWRGKITTFPNLLLLCHRRSSSLFSSPKWSSVRPRWDSNPQSPAPEADALSIRPLGHHRIRLLTPSPYAMSSSRPALALRGLAPGGVCFGNRPQRRQRAPAPLAQMRADPGHRAAPPGAAWFARGRSSSVCGSWKVLCPGCPLGASGEL